MGSLRVLLVEDEPLIGMTLVDMLEELGHRPIEAFTAREALDVFASHPDIDLVITDLGLPDRPGDALAQDLREKAPDIPVIFASGAPPTGAATRMPRMAHLSKPFRLDDLRDTIGRVFSAG